MSWLASQSSFFLTCKILECKVYFPHVPQVSPVQLHLYTMILQFPPCLLTLSQKELEQDLIWAMSYLWLFCAILLNDPIGVQSTLIYNYCWLPCSILPVLDPNWCTWSEFNVILFQLVPLSLHEFLSGLVYFFGY